MGETDVEKALVRVFSQRIETGEFDPAETVSYRQIGLSHFNTSAAQALALETARQVRVTHSKTPRHDLIRMVANSRWCS